MAIAFQISRKSFGGGLNGFERARRRHERGFARGVVKAGEFLMVESQFLVPIDTGALHDSAYVVSRGSGFEKEVDVGYSVYYAIFVHENLTVHHPSGQAKFLEQPAREKHVEMGLIVYTEMRAAKW